MKTDWNRSLLWAGGVGGSHPGVSAAVYIRAYRVVGVVIYAKVWDGMSE